MGFYRIAISKKQTIMLNGWLSYCSLNDITTILGRFLRAANLPFNIGR